MADKAWMPGSAAGSGADARGARHQVGIAAARPRRERTQPPMRWQAEAGSDSELDSLDRAPSSSSKSRGGGGGGGGGSGGADAPAGSTTSRRSSAPRRVESSEIVHDLRSTTPAPTTEEEWWKHFREFLRLSGREEYQPPVIGGVTIHFFKLWQLVDGLGGLDAVTSSKQWKRVYSPFNLPASITSSAYAVRSKYCAYLLPYERYIYGDTRTYEHELTGARPVRRPGAPRKRHRAPPAIASALRGAGDTGGDDDDDYDDGDDVYIPAGSSGSGSKRTRSSMRSAAAAAAAEEDAERRAARRRLKGRRGVAPPLDVRAQTRLRGRFHFPGGDGHARDAAAAADALDTSEAYTAVGHLLEPLLQPGGTSVPCVTWRRYVRGLLRDVAVRHSPDSALIDEQRCVDAATHAAMVPLRALRHVFPLLSGLHIARALIYLEAYADELAVWESSSLIALPWSVGDVLHLAAVRQPVDGDDGDGDSEDTRDSVARDGQRGKGAAASGSRSIAHAPATQAAGAASGVASVVTLLDDAAAAAAGPGDVCDSDSDAVDGDDDDGYGDNGEAEPRRKRALTLPSAWRRAVAHQLWRALAPMWRTVIRASTRHGLGLPALTHWAGVMAVLDSQHHALTPFAVRIVDQVIARYLLRVFSYKPSLMLFERIMAFLAPSDRRDVTATIVSWLLSRLRQHSAPAVAPDQRVPAINAVYAESLSLLADIMLLQRDFASLGTLLAAAPSCPTVRMSAQELANVYPEWGIQHATASILTALERLTDVLGERFFATPQHARQFESWKNTGRSKDHDFWRGLCTMLQEDHARVDALEDVLVPRLARSCDFVACAGGLTTPNYAAGLLGWLRVLYTATQHVQYSSPDSIPLVQTLQGNQEPGTMLGGQVLSHRWRYFTGWDEPLAEAPNHQLQHATGLICQSARARVAGSGKWHVVELAALLLDEDAVAPTAGLSGTAARVASEWFNIATLAHAIVHKQLYQLCRQLFAAGGPGVVYNTIDEIE